MTEQRGKIIVEGITAAKFWVRSLRLEADIEGVRAMMNDRLHQERKWGLVPVVGEYEVAPGFKFVYVLLIEVDALGIRNGNGAVYFGSPKHLKEVRQVRDRLAQPILEGLHAGRFDEVVEMPEKKEL